MTDEQATPDPQTTKFFVENLGDVNAEQLSAAEGRDAKAVQMFAAASVVIGLAVTSDRDLCETLLGAAIGAYSVAAIATGWAIWPRKLAIRPYDKLWRGLEFAPVTKARHTLVYLLYVAYSENERILRDKRRALVAIVIATGLETVLVALALMFALGAN